MPNLHFICDTRIKVSVLSKMAAVVERNLRIVMNLCKGGDYRESWPGALGFLSFIEKQAKHHTVSKNIYQL